MIASRYVGRVGRLAVVFGVGVAILTNCGIALADPGSPDASRSSVSGSATGRAAHSGWAQAPKHFAGTRTSNGHGSGAASTSPGVRASAAPDLNTVEARTRSTTPGNRHTHGAFVREDRPSSRPKGVIRSSAVPPPARTNSDSDATDGVGVKMRSTAPALPTLKMRSTAPRPHGRR